MRAKRAGAQLTSEGEACAKAVPSACVILPEQSTARQFASVVGIDATCQLLSVQIVFRSMRVVLYCCNRWIPC